MLTHLQSQAARWAVFSFFALLLINASLQSILAAGTVDPTFNAVPSADIGSDLNGGLAIQPDGKIIIYGTVGSNPAPFFQRLNADGSVDTTFNCEICNSFTATDVVIQPDRKILVSGFVSESTTSAIVYRLNADGSRDNTFVYPFVQSGFSSFSTASVRAVQADGKSYVVVTEANQGFTSLTIRRLNQNGSFDTTFTPLGVGGRLISHYISKVQPLPDGKLLVSGGSSSAGGAGTYLARYNSDGSRDTTFEQPTFADSNDSRPRVNDFEVLPNGNILLVGKFTTINGVPRQNFVKLQPAGNLDLLFDPTSSIYNPNQAASGVEVLSNGQIIVATDRFYRFNENGSLDNTFVSPAELNEINAWKIDSSNRILLLGKFGANKRYARLNADGSLDANFNPALTAPGTVTVIGAQLDGKIIVFGNFSKMNGVARNRLARLNADGTTDTSFDPGTGFNNSVFSIVVQPDGKILVGGNFTDYNGTALSGLARLLPNGSLDNSFAADVAGTVYSVALTADGKVVIGGSFGEVGGTARNGVARLLANGTLDALFNANLGTATVRSIVVQADGKIMVGGSFSGVGGFNRQNLVRLNSDGSLDSAFNAGNIAAVRQIVAQADGKYAILTATVTRLNNNGTTDTSFTAPTFGNSSSSTAAVNAIAVEPDNSIVIGGDFISVNNVPRARVARLRSDGRLDLTFARNGANRQVAALLRTANDRIVVGGEFTLIENTVRYGIARIISTPAQNTTLFDFDGDGRADISVFRPSNGSWYRLNSSNNEFFAQQFGAAGDLIAPADYDGDGRADLAVFRTNISGAGGRAFFYIFNSSNNTFRPEQFGADGDVPATGDWDGDGRADLAVYRAGATSGAQSFFFYRPSSQPNSDFVAVAWGVSGDKPVVGDYDGDGRADAGVYRPSHTIWYIRKSTDNGLIQQQLGAATDIPTPADFDGDGRTNIAVFRPSNGTWYTSTNPATNYGAIQFGTAGDVPVAADYDGDGRADAAVFRPSNGTWYVLRTSQGFFGQQFGTAEDKPAPAAFIN